MLCFSPHDACTAVFLKTMYLDRRRYTVFWPYTICRPNTKTKINRTYRHPHRRSVFFFLHVAIGNSLRSNNFFGTSKTHIFSYLDNATRCINVVLVLLITISYMRFSGKCALQTSKRAAANHRPHEVYLYIVRPFKPITTPAHCINTRIGMSTRLLQQINNHK